MRPTARIPPTTWAPMKLGADDGAIPAKRVREHAADGDGRVGEAGRAREEVGGADVGTDGSGCRRRPAGAGQGEDDEQQAEGGHDLGEEVRRRGPVLGGELEGGLGEHDVGDDRPNDAAGHLRREVGRGVPPGDAAEERRRRRTRRG